MSFKPSFHGPPGAIERDLDLPVSSLMGACLVDAEDLLRARLVRVSHDDNALPSEKDISMKRRSLLKLAALSTTGLRPRTVRRQAQPLH